MDGRREVKKRADGGVLNPWNTWKQAKKGGLESGDGRVARGLDRGYGCSDGNRIRRALT